jgi:hypothetical protein
MLSMQHAAQHAAMQHALAACLPAATCMSRSIQRPLDRALRALQCFPCCRHAAKSHRAGVLTSGPSHVRPVSGANSMFHCLPPAGMASR